MAAGLQIMDASGNVILDTSSSIGRQTGSATVGPSPTSGTISVPGYVSGDNVWYVAAYNTATLGDPPNLFDFTLTYFSVSGGTISWEAYAETKILYGLY